MRLPIKAQIVTSKNVQCVHMIKCVKVRTLFAKNKVRFARGEQLCFCSNTAGRYSSTPFNQYCIALRFTSY